VGHLETRRTLADWLATFEWHWFITLTFEKPRRSNALSLVPRWIERSIPGPYVHDALGWFGEEYHRDGERLHIHGLLYTDPICTFDRLRKSWLKIGRCKIERHDPTRGAVDYVAKYVSKDAGGRADWQMFEWYEGRRV